jgi:hypothetical protein
MSTDIKISNKDNISFDLHLRGKVNIVCGKSGTGKTYFSFLASQLSKSKESISGFSDVITINEDVMKIAPDWEPSISKALIIIDNADMVFRNNPSLVEKINHDRNGNTYLIFTRCGYGIEASPNYIGDFVRVGDTVTLEYKCSVKGWY